VTIWTTNALDKKDNFILKNMESTINGVNIRYFKNILRPDAMYFSPEMFLNMKKGMNDFDIIHIHSWRGFQDIFASIFSLSSNTPMVLHTHGTLPIFNRLKKTKFIYDRLIGRMILKSFKKVCALSDFEAFCFNQLGVAQKKIELLPNGIDLSKYSCVNKKGDFRKKYDISFDTKIILYVGRIDITKGLDVLLISLEKILKKLNNVLLVIMGPNAGYKDVLMSMMKIKSLNDNVIFTGFVDENIKFSALLDSDVFVTPYYSGFPLTFLEAVLFKCPIITLSNELKWINKVGKITCNSICDLTESILYILNIEDINDHYGNGFKEVIKEFDLDNVVSKLEDLYYSII